MDVLGDHFISLKGSPGMSRKEREEIVIKDDDDFETEDTTSDENLQYRFVETIQNEDNVAYRVVVNGCQSDNVNLSLDQSTSKSLNPRVATLRIENQREMTTGTKKRDERRRATHNEVERRRRDKINNWISKLEKLLPEYSHNLNGENDGKSVFESQSKGGILARACEYILELREANENLGHGLKENELLIQETKSLRQLVHQLRKENSQLKAQLLPNNNSVVRS
ncbi:upstream stimulatory factor 1 isoform X3 [Orussus abietinus]|uniref:upstream stimulatory factor 1 isoform X3 n=1 Tax=Orussus abietinus TaxID=222816 RepID=UPI000625DF63|nr:upstream stimulatory factor 1 isoform X3 [Orussus abietinus]